MNTLPRPASRPTRTPRSFARRPAENALWQQDAYRMIQRKAEAARIKTKIGNHTFRATGITAYLKNDGNLETAQQIAGRGYCSLRKGLL